MVSVDPLKASGGMIALTREPSARRASTSGEDSSIRRPTRETIRSMTRRRCSSEVNRVRGALELAAALDVDRAPGPLTMISVTAASSSSRCSGP